jgi:hypothetical protein
VSGIDWLDLPGCATYDIFNLVIDNNLRLFFWDVNFEAFDPHEYPGYTISRLLEVGDEKAIAWLRKEFSGTQIEDVVRSERRLSLRSANFWALVYKIPREEVAALRNDQIVSRGEASQKMFHEELLIQKLVSSQAFSVTSKAESTLHAAIAGVKVSFLGYPYPVLFPVSFFQGVRVVDPRDIACMKISAIASRGTRRDFIDLYVVSREHGLASLLESFRTKYSQVNYSQIHILKSLTYFEEAERDPIPDMLEKISWNDVRSFFTTEVPGLL